MFGSGLQKASLIKGFAWHLHFPLTELQEPKPYITKTVNCHFLMHIGVHHPNARAQTIKKKWCPSLYISPKNQNQKTLLLVLPKLTLRKKNVRKARMKIPDAKRHPPKDAKVPFGGMPIHVDMLPKGTPTSRPTTPRSNVRLWVLQCKARRSASGTKVMMVVFNGWRQIRMRPQQMAKPGRDGPHRRGRFAGECPKVSIGGRPACPCRLMSGVPSCEKGRKSGNAQSRAWAHMLPRYHAPSALGAALAEHHNVIYHANVSQKEQMARNFLVEKDEVQYNGGTSPQCSDIRQTEIQDPKNNCHLHQRNKGRAGRNRRTPPHAKIRR